jgi:hypothetical protein
MLVEVKLAQELGRVLAQELGRVLAQEPEQKLG